MRRCTRCPTSRMRDHVRHLHELEEGQRFDFEGEPEVGAHELHQAGDCTCRYVPHQAAAPAPEAVRFETRWGRAVTFRAMPRANPRPCAPGAQVVPWRGR